MTLAAVSTPVQSLPSRAPVRGPHFAGLSIYPSVIITALSIWRITSAGLELPELVEQGKIGLSGTVARMRPDHHRAGGAQRH